MYYLEFWTSFQNRTSHSHIPIFPALSECTNFAYPLLSTLLEIRSLPWIWTGVARTFGSDFSMTMEEDRMVSESLCCSVRGSHRCSSGSTAARIESRLKRSPRMGLD